MIKYTIALFFLILLFLPPAQASAQVCKDSQYNECIGCDTSRRILKHNCGAAGTAYETLVDSQSDSGCHDWCPVSDLEKAETPQARGVPATCKRTYNECRSCNKSNNIEENKCSAGEVAYTILTVQYDTACSSLCNPGQEQYVKNRTEEFSRADFNGLCGPKEVASKYKTCDCVNNQVVLNYFCGGSSEKESLISSEICSPQEGSCNIIIEKVNSDGIPIKFKETSNFTIQNIDPQPTITHPKGSLILTGGQTNVSVGQAVEITAIGQAYKTRKLKEVSVLIARIPEAGESNLRYKRIDNCALGFTGQSEDNNSNWCWLLKGSTLAQNTIKWTSTKPGTYSVIMGVYDDKLDEVSSFCSSNYVNFPPNSAGYAETGPYIDGKPTRYWKCDENNKDTLTLRVSNSNTRNTIVPIGYHISNTPIADTITTPSVSVSTFPMTIDYSLLNDGNNTKIVYVRFFYSSGKYVDRQQIVVYRPGSAPTTPTPTPPAAISPSIDPQSCLDVCYSTDLRTNVGKDSSGQCNASVSSTSHLCRTNTVGSTMRCNGVEYQCVDRGASGGLFWTATGN